MALTKIPSELSSTTGIVDNSNATAITIDSNENVGIGTSSPNGSLVVSSSGAEGVEFFPNSFTNGNTIQHYDRSSSVYSSVKHIAADHRFNIGSTERMRIDASGNLLVGKTNTTGNVAGISLRSTGLIVGTVDNGTVGYFNRTNGDGTVLDFRKDNSAVGSINSISGAYLAIGTGDSGLAFDDDYDTIVPWNTTSNSNRSGFISLGSGTQQFKDLYLSGNVTHGTTPSSSAAGVFTEAVGRTTYSRGSGVGGFGHLSFINGNGAVGSIVTSGSATAYNTSSDYRLKENAVAITGATDRLKQLAPKRFNFIADADTTVDGFLAHEVADVVPEAISGEKDAVDADGNPEYQGIDQSKLVPLLVATIQELEARITELENN